MRIVTILIATCIATGCATYNVGVTSYLATDQPFPLPNADALFAVVAESEPLEPLLEHEVRRKLAYLLEQRGYPVERLSDETTRFLVAADFGIDDGRTVIGSYTIDRPGYVRTSYVYAGKGRKRVYRTFYPGYSERRYYRYKLYTSGLSLTLYDHRRARELEAADQPVDEAIIWRATAQTEQRSSDLRKHLDYLLLAALEKWGADTGPREEVRLAEGDERATELREATRPEPVFPGD